MRSSPHTCGSTAASSAPRLQNAKRQPNSTTRSCGTSVISPAIAMNGTLSTVMPVFRKQ